MNSDARITALLRSLRQKLYLLGIVWLAVVGLNGGSEGQQIVRYGITPYQDSALPIVAAMKGWYQEEGIKVELVPLAWGDVVTALSSGSIDVAIYNLNSFLAPYQNAALRSPKPVFYAPLYVFKGQAIMVRGDSGWQTVDSSQTSTSHTLAEAVSMIAAQLKGKRVCVTKGTELEQLVLAAMAKADLEQSDVNIIYASPEDCLAAFLAKSIDSFAAGLTERVESHRHGAVELLTTSDVMMPVIDGLVTTENFASKDQDVLDKLVLLWFKTINYIAADVPGNSVEIRDYLRKTASTRYSPQEYAIAWTFNIFPHNVKEANDLFNRENSQFYWKKSWDGIEDFLISQNQAKARAPYAAYLGEGTFGRSARTK
jgi:NitT/TauT family transport system substrate-binding protein